MTSDELRRDAKLVRESTCVIGPSVLDRAADEIDRLTKRVEELEAERDAVYLAGGHPPEQCRHENLRNFVATRFVPNHEYNRLVEELNHLVKRDMGATKGHACK